MSAPPIRLAVVITHPVQYWVQFYRAVAADPRFELKVFFSSYMGQRAVLDPGMGQKVIWASPLTEGFPHEFLPGAENVTRLGFRDVNTPALKRHLAAFKPDALLIHGYGWMDSLRALAFAWARGLPAFLTYDNSIQMERGGFKALLKRLILPRILRRFSGYFAFGARNRDFVTHYGARRDRVFDLPVLLDVHSFGDAAASGGAERSAWRTQLGVSDGDVLFLLVGKLIPRKRPADILHALHQAKRAQAVAVFAGDGVLRPALEEEARALGVRALFPGFVNLDALPGLYRAADVFVHSAEEEAFGMVAVEAAASGLPMVIADTMGAIDPNGYARPDETALIYPMGDAQALAGAIQRLCDDAPLRLRMGSASSAAYAARDARKALAALSAALAACGIEGR